MCQKVVAFAIKESKKKKQKQSSGKASAFI